jgi:hypothetical protein
VPGLPTLDALLGQMGEPGQTILGVERDQGIIRENALNYERLNELVYNPGNQVFGLPAAGPSPWSEIIPGVIAQLVIQQGNLGLNTLNFRVLPQGAQTGSNFGTARVMRTAFVPGGQQKLAMTAVELPTIAALFGLFIITAETIDIELRIKARRGNIGYSAPSNTDSAANTINASQALSIVMNNNGEDDYCARARQQALQEAPGNGFQIIPPYKIGDPRYRGGDWAKYAYNLKTPRGLIQVHFMHNVINGKETDFKISVDQCR